MAVLCHLGCENSEIPSIIEGDILLKLYFLYIHNAFRFKAVLEMPLIAFPHTLSRW